MMMVARGLVRLTIDGDDTSHTTHNLRDCFRVHASCWVRGVVRSMHQVKVSSAVFFFSWKHSSECKQNVSTCECGVGDTKEVARTPRLRSGGREESGTRTDGDTDSELMASELRLGFSENYYFFEGWAVGGTRMLSMVDRLFDKGFAKLFRLILMKK